MPTARKPGGTDRSPASPIFRTVALFDAKLEQTRGLLPILFKSKPSALTVIFAELLANGRKTSCELAIISFMVAAVTGEVVAACEVKSASVRASNATFRRLSSALLNSSEPTSIVIIIGRIRANSIADTALVSKRNRDTKAKIYLYKSILKCSYEHDDPDDVS